MTIIFENVTVGGITITDEIPNMRSLLSPTGQAEYDAATVGDFFNVSSTDYANVASGLVYTTKYVMDDSQVAAAGSGWSSSGGGFAHAQSTATVPSGVYLIGFVFQTRALAGTTVGPLISSSFPPSASYDLIANIVEGPTLSGLNYYLRKAPPSATSSTSYLGLYINGQVNATSAISGQKYYSSSSGLPPYTSWTGWTSTEPSLQVLGTTLQQW